jgi:cell division septation protein DedD
VRTLTAGAALLAVGAMLGIVLGALMDAPRLLLHRLNEPVQTVEIGSDMPGVGATQGASEPVEELAQYEALQEEAPPRRAPRRPAPTSPAPEVAKPPPPKAPEPVAVAIAPMETPSAEALIEAIAEEHKSPAPPPPGPAKSAAPASGPVVQVGAFPDARSAGALVAQLQAQGFNSYLSSNSTSRYPHRVRVRPGASGDATVLAGELERRGFEVWVTQE